MAIAIGRTNGGPLMVASETIVRAPVCGFTRTTARRPLSTTTSVPLGSTTIPVGPRNGSSVSTTVTSATAARACIAHRVRGTHHHFVHPERERHLGYPRQSHPYWRPAPH